MQRSKIEVYIHYVWATKHREPYLQESDVERRVHRCVQAQAEKLGCGVLAINGMPDHVHLLLQMPATVTISQIAQKIKGVSSTFARASLFGGDAFDWQDHYGAISVTPRHLDQVTDYICGQKQHHAEGTTRPKWEEWDEAA